MDRRNEGRKGTIINLKNAYYFGAESWIRDAPPAVIKDYEAKDILHSDETGLCSPALPEGTLSFKNSERAACKMAKEQATLVCMQHGREREAEATYYWKKQNPNVFQEREDASC
ncbi:hypothetical protein RF11_14504 [Thelohanellus kitauei]|uniref:DDE-1 domain-containing protein n=1 Tax=Thelohanellus kitauei TaxID=669202 RepID=A0A0C2IHI2_THEKT|nr:hypothetical protein RF11_14504 [Thelohanellus kitauei]